MGVEVVHIQNQNQIPNRSKVCLGGEQCPSTADSSAVSLSQMAFLSMSVSIFRYHQKTLQALVTWNKYFCSTVANIANNLNNNNNNQNDNNLNFVNQQNNNLNMNQNIINQLNIDLPPPVPGRRKRSGRDSQIVRGKPLYPWTLEPHICRSGASMWRRLEHRGRAGSGGYSQGHNNRLEAFNWVLRCLQEDYANW